MRKLIIFLLLTYAGIAQGQTVYQLNYDSIRVGRTAGTGATSLYGKTYLKNVSGRTAGDSILSIANGRIYKVPYSGVNLWTRSGTTLSPATANDSINIGTGVYKGHGAKSDASDGFLIEASNGTDVGRFGVANTANSSLFGSLNVSGNLTGDKLYSANPTAGAAGTDSIMVHDNSTNEIRRISPTYYQSAITLATIGSSPNTNGATLSSGTLTLQPASASFGGVITTGVQTFSGSKTFNGNVFMNPSTNGSNGGVTIASNSGSLTQPLIEAASESANSYLYLTGRPSLSIDGNNPVNAFQFAAFKNNGSNTDLTGGNLLNILNNATSRFRVDYLGNTTTTGTFTLADEAYTSSWNGKLEAPTKNAIWDAGFLSASTAASTYLPLTGGTLTGAVSSNSAISSSNSIIASTGGGSIFLLPGLNPAINIASPYGSNGYINHLKSSVSKWYTGFVGATRPSSYRIYNSGTSSTALEIDTATNAVTLIGALSGTSFSGTSFLRGGSYTGSSIIGGRTDASGAVGAELQLENLTASSPLNTGTRISSWGMNNAGARQEAARIDFVNLRPTGWAGAGTYDGTIRLSTNNGTSITTAVTISNNQFVQFNGYGAGTLVTDASGNITASSDERLKTGIKKYTSGLQALSGISPITYKWNKESKMDTVNSYTGFSAQNVQKNIPEAVGKMKNGNLTIDDRPILATMINAINELRAQVEALQAQIKALQK